MKTKILTFLLVLGCCGFAFSQNGDGCPVAIIDTGNPPALPPSACVGDNVELCLDTNCAGCDLTAINLGYTATPVDPGFAISQNGAQVCFALVAPAGPDVCAPYDITVTLTSVNTADPACTTGNVGYDAGFLQGDDINDVIDLLPELVVTIYPDPNEFAYEVVPGACGEAATINPTGACPPDIAGGETLAAVDEVCPDPGVNGTYEYTITSNYPTDAGTNPGGCPPDPDPAIEDGVIAFCPAVPACTACPAATAITPDATEVCSGTAINVCVDFDADADGVMVDVNGVMATGAPGDMQLCVDVPTMNMGCGTTPLTYAITVTCDNAPLDVAALIPADATVYPDAGFTVVTNDNGSTCGTPQIEVFAADASSCGTVDGTACVANDDMETLDGATLLTAPPAALACQLPDLEVMTTCAGCADCPVITAVDMPVDGCDATMQTVCVTYDQDPTGLVTTDINGVVGTIDPVAFTICYDIPLANTTCDPTMLDFVHTATCVDGGANILDVDGVDTNGSIGMINVYPIYDVVVVQPACDGAAGSAEVQVNGVACATPTAVIGTAGVTNVCPTPAPGTPATLVYDFSADANIVAATAAGCAPTGEALMDDISNPCDLDPCPPPSDFTFTILDPCVCNGDETYTVAGGTAMPDNVGTFGELIQVQGPTGFTLTTDAASTGGTASMTLTENPAGSGNYELAFNHVTNVGYTANIFAEDASGNVTPVGSISNICAYPEYTLIDATIDLDVCSDGSLEVPPAATIPITLSANSGAASTGTFSPDPFDPNQGAGTYTIMYTGVTTADDGNAGVSPDGGTTPAFPSTADCPIAFDQMVTVEEVDICVIAENIPTVGQWGLIILGLLMSITAVVGIRQRREEEAYS